MSYKDLKSYQNAVVIYDYTVEFCNLYIDKKSRTTDQMVQAARSGKQNITEAVSNPAWENPKLLGVARASLKELLEDYEDFLRQKNLRQWKKQDREAVEVRNLVYRNKSYKSDRSDREGAYETYKTYQVYLSDPEKAANAALCIINQTTYLLDQQIKASQKIFPDPHLALRLRLNQEHKGDEWLRQEIEKIKKKDTPDK